MNMAHLSFTKISVKTTITADCKVRFRASAKPNISTFQNRRTIGIVTFRMASETFNLSWNDFDTCTRKTFQNLISDQDFTDVTLACVDNRQIKAHKVILSACSPFFRSLLLSNPHQHPLVYLKGVHYTDLLSIIQFIYLGQTQVMHTRLENFMLTARELEIQGLITEPGSEERKEDTHGVSLRHTSEGETDWDNRDQYLSHSSNMEDDASVVHSVVDGHEEELGYDFPGTPYNIHNLTPSKQDQLQMKRSTGHEKKHACDQCDYRGLTPQHVREHKMSIHEGIKFSCDMCDKVYSHPNNLRTHKKTKH